MVDDESKVLEVEYFEDFAGRVGSKVWVCFIAMAVISTDLVSTRMNS